MSRIVLKGITWNHSRGIAALQAASQRFSELHPVDIEWRKRSLQEFADASIEELTKQYDLLIIDHPWVGCAAATQCVLPLEQYLPAGYLADQQRNSVGGSHESYYYGSHQWALAIDAATQVASYRPDLLGKRNIPVPRTWQDVLALAREKKLAVPSIPIDLLMCFYMFCIAHGTAPFLQEDEVIDKETGLLALNTMQELWSLVDEPLFFKNPIAVAELMTSTDDYWYCPFAYGYSNYSRKGYSRHLLQYTDLVSFQPGQPLRSTVGGTGLALSACTRHSDWALQFAAWVVSPQIQSTLYMQCGGQPGHRQAWISEDANRLCGDFFSNTMATISRGYIRPRYHGYLYFQDHAGIPLQQYLMGAGSAADVLAEMNLLYRKSKTVSAIN